MDGFGYEGLESKLNNISATLRHILDEHGE